MLTFSAVNGEILAEQWRLQSETTPRPPNYTIALPALLAGPKCYADAATEPDNIQHTHTHRNTGLVIFINNTQTQPVHHIYIYIHRQLSLMQVLFWWPKQLLLI
jgi:hypothetical protein